VVGSSHPSGTVVPRTRTDTLIFLIVCGIHEHTTFLLNLRNEARNVGDIALPNPQIHSRKDPYT